MAKHPALQHPERDRQRPWVPALKIALIYALFAALWIVFSDRAIDLISLSKNMLSALQTWKGLFFVLITSILVFVLGQYYFRRQVELINALRNNQQRLNLILDTIPDGIQENDLEGRITYSNPGHHKILGYPNGSLVGYHIWDFQVNQHDQKQMQDYFFYLLRQQPAPETIISRNQTRSGQERILEVSWDYQRDRDGALTGFISVISDITQSRAQEEEILHLAYYDPLTDLPNRFRALENLESMIKVAKKASEHVAVLMLDLDHFKKINDSLGHDTGDRLLQQLVTRLKEVLSTEQILGRLGGDEFIIIQHQTSQRDALPAMIEAVKALFRRPFVIDQREMLLTASIGVAIYPNDGTTATELLRNADSAMFHAKESGRNSCSYFTRAMNLDVTRRFTIEEQLHSALERGELNLMYQPQVALQDHGINGAEALLRWHNPVLGQVSPEEFIPVAEQSSLILPIGRYVLEQAMKVLAQIQLSKPHFRMAINLSPVQFRDFGLVDSLNQLIRQYQIRPSNIELEITEGVLLGGSSVVKETLEALHQMGVTLAMDDFGTGYSSLSYLRSYPFDVLKIDRSFVNEIFDKPANKELINAIVAMSEGLGLKVVAEGVETKEQCEFLLGIGCDYGQGYFFSKPVSETELLSQLG
ncbi:putative bifunctional diguanylate cyclase/phosphodiesterase [Methylophaga sp. OBS1]|jgi:diguanylate cyclase (GGDEF)-like protein/PAS domain S-box-containing protein|uniref:putative bifunctional diguanylate cyclase/phosphodiesterase n=1 Tax=Methylophaga sp. OBS1 TaxID=2991933 RepID=UPI0022519572|nr:bifunctional diguanylate cyclase/phosphodiesterase [Methylophaga sp. OBS1]MCX4192902.1 EAL domain-containing protein [Methylophaga sp. OBS1]